MRRKLTIAAAVAVALASGAAAAAEMPAYGTKNFVPGADTPAYLSHESAAAPVGAADRDINDRAEVAAFSTPAEESASPGASRRGKHAAAGRSSKRHGASARSSSRSAHTAKGKTTTAARTASGGKSVAHGAVRSSGVTKVKATKPARSSKSTARHAATKPAVKSGRLALAGDN
jgi:hypothetical protein